MAMLRFPLVPWQCALLCDHFGLAAGSVETDLFVLRQHTCNRTRLAEMHPNPLPLGFRFFVAKGDALHRLKTKKK